VAILQAKPQEAWSISATMSHTDSDYLVLPTMTLMTRRLLTIYLHVKCHTLQAVSVLYQISLLESLLLHDSGSKLGISEAGSSMRLQKSFRSSTIPLLLFLCIPPSDVTIQSEGRFQLAFVTSLTIKQTI
jgi:hypothetical protein